MENSPRFNLGLLPLLERVAPSSARGWQPSAILKASAQLFHAAAMGASSLLYTSASDAGC